MSEENKTNPTEETSEPIQTDYKKEKTEREKEKTETKIKRLNRKGKQKKKTDAELKGLSMKERRRVLEERKAKRRKKWYLAIGIIVVVLILGLLFFDSGCLQRNLAALKVGDKTYSAAELDYYYYASYNGYSSYASYYGLDTSKSLKDQEIYSGTTWYDYFRDNAKKTLTNVAVLVQEAEKANYSLSEDGQKTVSQTLKELKNNCEKNGYTVTYYLRASYGRYMSETLYEKMLNEGQLAQEYEIKMKKSFKQSDKDVQNYYKKNKAELDTFKYQAYLVPVSTDTQTDSDGNTTSATTAETKKAETKAKKGADALKQALTDNDQNKVADLVKEYSATDYSNQAYSSFSGYDFSDWLTNEDRKADDTTSMKYETEDSDKKTTLNGYYVVRFEKRYLDQYHSATYRNILIKAESASDGNSSSSDSTDQSSASYDYDAAKKKAEKLKKTWQSNGGDSGAFADLTADNSEDTTSNENGGLYEEVSKTDVSDTLKAWLFDEKRKKGDFAILKDEENTGYQLVYFENYSDKYQWENVSIAALQDADYSDWYDDVAKDYKESTTLMYHFV